MSLEESEFKNELWNDGEANFITSEADFEPLKMEWTRLFETSR